MALPRVTEEVCTAIIGQANDDPKGYLHKAYERMGEENPVLRRAIDGTADKHPRIANELRYMALFVAELISAQSETNFLERLGENVKEKGGPFLTFDE